MNWLEEQDMNGLEQRYFTLYPASYIKQEMDCPYVQGKICKIPYPQDDISGKNFYQYDREHGKRYSVVRICICAIKSKALQIWREIFICFVPTGDLS